MPRKRSRMLPGVRRYGTKSNYSIETFHKALDEIQSGTISQRKAAKNYNIPRSTLKNKLKQKHGKAVGRPAVLTRDEEVIIVDPYNCS